MTAPSPGRFDARLRSAAREARCCRSPPWSDPRIFSRPRLRRRALVCVRITAEAKRNIVFITSEVAPAPSCARRTLLLTPLPSACSTQYRQSPTVNVSRCADPLVLWTAAARSRYPCRAPPAVCLHTSSPSRMSRRGPELLPSLTALLSPASNPQGDGPWLHQSTAAVHTERLRPIRSTDCVP